MQHHCMVEKKTLLQKGCVENHSIVCLSSPNGVTADADLEWLLIFAQLFWTCFAVFYLIEFVSPFSYSFNLTSSMFTDVSQDY